ncbi:2-oxoglutarate dehydrogenase complex dihydrolipoyllysine-residue succinyltransferase [Bavariicoccus seileri]|uniref:2-oxoglutarate dehydrogenase complex dihydrolipoyllysine-residue succinyltransferase n=1 Tax=Bavariicoccus seileri TaxID=549685 RepID=UPI003F90A855
MKDIIIPEIAESIQNGTISAWLVNVGDTIKEGDPILELETDKIAVEVNAEASGTLAEILKGDLEDVDVGEIVGKIELGTTDKQSADEKEESEQEPVEKEERKKEDLKIEDSKKDDSKIEEKAGKIEANHSESTRKSLTPEGSPSSRRERRWNKDAKQSSGEKKVLDETQATQATKETTSSEKVQSDNRRDDPKKPVTIEKFSRRRQTIASRLVEAQRTMAMLTTFNEVDMTNIIDLRKEVQEDFISAYDTKLGFMSFVVKAAVGALKAVPALNSELDGQNLILKEYYDISVAVSTDDGLVVPVIRECDHKNFGAIEKDLASLAEKARTGKLALEDMQGGTFTITNGGVFGSTFSTPIINMPQAAILGMHNIVKRPVAMPDGTVQIRPMMQLALTYDHRIVDGKEAATFLTYFTKLLADPKKLLLEG